jgi:flagellar motor switch protein FliM
MQPKDPIGDEVIWKESDDADGVADLLGFDFESAGSIDRSGLRALVNSVFVPHRRLPMLDVVFDRTARLMTTALRQLTDENFEAALDDVSSTRFGDFQQSIAAPSLIAVGRADALDSGFLVACDASLLTASVDALLGGRRRAAAVSEERAFTAIELAIAQRVFAALIGTLAEAFSVVQAGEFRLQRIETTPRFAVIAQDASVCALAKYRVRFDGGAGKVSVLFPNVSLEPIRESLARAFVGEMREAERVWVETLSREVRASSVELAAVIAERAIAFGDLRSLKPGDTLAFPDASGAAAELRAGGVNLGRARVGRSGDFAAVKLGEAS